MTVEEFKKRFSNTSYYKWNQALVHFFFNENKAEKEVYLFVTKEDIIKVGKKLDLQERDQDIFQNFISAIRTGLPGTPSNKSILHQAIHSYEIWESSLFDSDNDFPLYFNYLILFVLPLTETKIEKFRHNVYYPKLRFFLEKNNLSDCPYQNSNLNWNCLWEDLERWSILDRNTEIGFFELHKFSNQNWNYVGKPLLQCIFPANAIKRLPIFFEKAGIVPSEEISEDRLRNIIKIHGSHYLGLSNSLTWTSQNQKGFRHKIKNKPSSGMKL